jgi:hypothetical protein
MSQGRCPTSFCLIKQKDVGHRDRDAVDFMQRFMLMRVVSGNLFVNKLYFCSKHLCFLNELDVLDPMKIPAKGMKND